MFVIIVEDEILIANRIERLTKEILGGKLIKIQSVRSLPQALEYISEFPVDLLLLDLNLHGRDGFEILRQAVSGSFHTIIISAHTEKAIEAFKYGVLDFIGKPFTAERLRQAFGRLENVETRNKYPTKYIAVRKSGALHLIDVDSIEYIRGAGIYSDIVLRSNIVEIHDKPLNRLISILPTNFIRIHKSFIVNIRSAGSIESLGGSKYKLRLLSGEELPVSRTQYKTIKELLSR